MAMHDLNCDHPTPVFTRRHYELVADALNKVVNERHLEAVTSTHDEAVMRDIVVKIDAAFLEDNHLYNSTMFWQRVYNIPHRELPIAQTRKHKYLYR